MKRKASMTTVRIIGTVLTGEYAGEKAVQIDNRFSGVTVQMLRKEISDILVNVGRQDFAREKVDK